MAATALLAGLLLAQAVAPSITVEGGADRIDVGYDQLAAGDAAAAIERIRANRRIEPGEPAALINLGSAYARLGRTDEARDRYMAAIGSKIRYDLELADGTWMDSRRAARLAIRMLDQGHTLALR